MSTTSTSSGWNRSTSTPKPAPKKPSAMRGVVAGLVVVALAVVCAVVFMGKGEKPVEKTEKERGRIKEVTPAATPKTPEQAEKDAHPGMVKVRGKWYPEYDKNGGKIWISGAWVKYHTPQIMTNSSTLVTLESKVFDNSADRDIAVLLHTPPGTQFLAKYEYGERFVNAFLESLKTPIVVEPDDDEVVAALKKAVRETKIELKARYDAGEDIAKIMADTRKQYQELGAYREEVRKMVQQASAETGGDLSAHKDLYEAANKMLADRGIKPLTMPKMLFRKLEVNSLKEKGKNK